MARYASDPTLPAGPMPMMGGSKPTGALFPMTMGTNLSTAARAGNVNPNPAAAIKAPTPVLATAQGVQQSQQ